MGEVNIEALIRLQSHDERFPSGDSRCGCISCRTFGLSPDSVAYRDEMRSGFIAAFVDLLEAIDDAGKRKPVSIRRTECLADAFDKVLESLRSMNNSNK